ncbi:MAG: pyridoxal-5'-phosphate-dependent protein beta subunit [Promethearchaeota archaeon CR_4]|nr:MAG: pyridoxal-5'-phosphate-dependent protein beta subunit [Candidatus Lokiarchaeota archaeon CR_4]
MPRNSPLVKVNATRGYGAEVVFCENTLASRKETPNKLIKLHDYTLVHLYDNENVICGQGTVALELLKDVSNLDDIFALVGGGGFLSETAIATKGFNPKIRVYGCDPNLADDAFRSLEAGKIMTNDHPTTIADGLRGNLCERTFTILQQFVDQIVTVSEQEILVPCASSGSG